MCFCAIVALDFGNCKLFITNPCNKVSETIQIIWLFVLNFKFGSVLSSQRITSLHRFNPSKYWVTLV